MTAPTPDALVELRDVTFGYGERPVLRDLALKCGKNVELVTQGEATELDKSLVEKITDPLTHLVRNSCDHGIETLNVAGPRESRRPGIHNLTGALLQAVNLASHRG